MKMAVVVAALGSMLVVSGCATGFKGSTVVSTRFQSEAKRVTVMFEGSSADGPTLWFLAQLNEAFMKNGYEVTERLHYPRALHALMAAETDHFGTGGGTNLTYRHQSVATHDSYGFTPEEIKKIGERYGVDFIAVYTKWASDRACLRLVDCSTAEVVATSMFLAPYNPKMSGLGEAAADMFVLSLQHAYQQTAAQGVPVHVYLDVCPSMKSEGRLSGIKKILYQKRITGSVSAYAVIYTAFED